MIPAAVNPAIRSGGQIRRETGKAGHRGEAGHGRLGPGSA